MHVRAAIRQYVYELLLDQKYTGNRVYQERVFDVEGNQTPAILIYSKSEESSPDTIGTPRGLGRLLTLSVEIYHSAVNRPDSRLDDIAEIVEQQIGDDRHLGGLALDTYLIGTEMETRGDGDKLYAVYTLEYLVTYRTPDNNGGTTL